MTAELRSAWTDPEDLWSGFMAVTRVSWRLISMPALIFDFEVLGMGCSNSIDAALQTCAYAQTHLYVCAYVLRACS